MNFGKTEYSHFLKNIKLSSKKIKDNPTSKKMVASFSNTNYFPKNKKNGLFLRTMNHFDYKKINNIKDSSIQLKKIKFKKSSSAIFQSNDVDLVRNLNFDSLAQFNDNIQLKENLINSVNNNIGKKIKSEKKENEEIDLPKLSKISNYKSYELIQTQKKKIKNEISEQLQKELINKLKLLRIDCQNKKLEKDKIFQKIKKINEQLEEIDAENYYFNEKYKQQMRDINKKRKETPEKKEEIFRNKFKLNLEKSKKRNHKGSLMDIFNFNQNEKDNNNTQFKINNNNISVDNSKISNIKNESLLENENKNLVNKIQNLDSSTNVLNNFNSKEQKLVDGFVLNVLQSQQKKEYKNFQKQQYDKIRALKEECKNLNKILNEIDIELEMNKKKEKKIINRLMTFYKELLFKGKNVKKEGLVWLVKAIWNLGENVPMSFMPEFLDFESIDYLFKLAHKQLEIENCNKKIKEIKLKLKKELEQKYSIVKLNTKNNKNNYSNYNESNNMSSMVKSRLLNMKNESETIESEDKKDYKDLIKEYAKKENFDIIKNPDVSYIDKIKKHIEQIELDIIELKKKEINRIYKCFIEYDYENKYHTNIETVLSALIGVDAKDTEMNHFNMEKKNYITTIKNIRFFDHEHTRKILSK